MPLECLQGQGDSPYKDIALTCLFNKETASLSLSLFLFQTLQMRACLEGSWTLIRELTYFRSK